MLGLVLAWSTGTHGFACSKLERSMVRHSSVHRAAPPAMMAKGFGKAPQEQSKPKPPSDGKKKRDAAAAKLDALKATGNPEYMVSIRTVGAGGMSEWMPVGGLAVPRSNSVDTAVSMAIFNNEDELLKGAFRAFPKLKASTDKFEYGERPPLERNPAAYHRAAPRISTNPAFASRPVQATDCGSFPTTR